MKKIGIIALSVLGTVLVGAGGVAINNAIPSNKNKVNISYGETNLIGKPGSNTTTEGTHPEVKTNLCAFNNLLDENLFYAIAVDSQLTKTPPDPVLGEDMEGCTFLGWSTEAGNPDKIVKPGTYVVTEDTIFYAVYKDADENIVLRDLNFQTWLTPTLTGSFSSTQEQSKLSESLNFTTLEEQYVIVSGYSLAGYSLSKDSTEILGDDYTIKNEDLTVYAVYQKDGVKYSISNFAAFSVNLGQESKTVLFNKNDADYKTQCATYLATLTPTSDAGTFAGFSTEPNGTVIDLTTFNYAESMNLYAIFQNKLTQLSGFTEMSWNGLTNFYGNAMWSDGENIYYSLNADQFVLNKDTQTWERKEWNGLTTFVGHNVYTDGENVYMEDYVLDKTTNTWTETKWRSFPAANGVGNFWSDGETLYYTYSGTTRVLNKTSNSWEIKNWNGEAPREGRYIWSDGENIYFSQNEKQLILNKDTQTWETKEWNGVEIYSGEDVFVYGENVYYFLNKVLYVLDKETSTWVVVELNETINTFDIYGSYFWTDGENLYCSCGKIQYKFY